VDRFVAKHRLLRRSGNTDTAVQDTLFNTRNGFAEVLIPPRSGLIGEAMFPGMITPSGDLIVLAIQRKSEHAGPGEITLAAGDTLLLKGSWAALDALVRDPDVLVVDQPDLIRRQAVEFGTDGKIAIAVLAVMVGLLATGAVPRVFAGLLAACVLLGLRVLKIDQAYRAINWTALIMVASLIPLSTAMEQTGAAHLMAEELVRLVGNASPYALLAALFTLTALLNQVISSTAAALILIPIAISAASEVGVAPRTALVTVAVASATCFLTPVASSCNLMVQGPGGYRFGDYWKLGLPLVLWFFVIAVFLVPVFWPF
jgi:di/tricarboxylate transporter